MILPIVAYGHPVLRSKCIDIDSSYKDLDKLINDMWDTMYSSDGVGLAAPQIGKSLRLFIVDANPLSDSEEFDEKLKMAMINDISSVGQWILFFQFSFFCFVLFLGQHF